MPAKSKAQQKLMGWLPKIFIGTLGLTAVTFIAFAIAFIMDDAILGMLSIVALAISLLGLSFTLRWGERDH